MLEPTGHYDLNAARRAGYRLLERLDAEEALVQPSASAAAEQGPRAAPAAARRPSALAREDAAR